MAKMHDACTEAILAWLALADLIMECSYNHFLSLSICMEFLTILKLLCPVKTVKRPRVKGWGYELSLDKKKSWSPKKTISIHLLSLIWRHVTKAAYDYRQGLERKYSCKVKARPSSRTCFLPQQFSTESAAQQLLHQSTYLSLGLFYLQHAKQVCLDPG